AAAAARPAAARDAATAPAAAFPRPARGTRPRARSRDRSRAWAPRTRKSGSDTPPALAPSLLLPGRRLVRGRLVPDGGANQRPQQIAPLGALEEGGEVLVHRRIFQQPAHRPLPGLESVRDHPEIGHGRPEVGGRLAHRPIALLAEQPADEPLALDQPVRDLAEVAGHRADILGHRLVPGIAEERTQETRPPPGPPAPPRHLPGPRFVRGIEEESRQEPRLVRPRRPLGLVDRARERVHRA